MKLKHISLAVAALSLQLTNVQGSIESVAADAAAKKAKEDEAAQRQKYLDERFEKNDLVAQFNLPDTWCQDGTRKVLDSKPALLNVKCPPCYHGHYPDAAAWFTDQLSEYQESETFETVVGEEKTHPYFIFYNLRTIACLPKTMDQAAQDDVKSEEDLDKSIEVYKHKDMFHVNQHLEVVSDRFNYGKMQGKDIDSYLASRGFHKSPELVESMGKLREAKEKSGQGAKDREALEQVKKAAQAAKGHFDKKDEVKEDEGKKDL